MNLSIYGKAQIKLRGTKQQLIKCIKHTLMPMDWCDNILGYEVKEYSDCIEFFLSPKYIQASKNSKSFEGLFRRWVLRNLGVSYSYYNSYYFMRTDKENEFMVTLEVSLEDGQDFIQDIKYFSKEYGLIVRFFVCYSEQKILRNLEARRGIILIDENKTIKQVRWEYPFLTL